MKIKQNGLCTLMLTLKSAAHLDCDDALQIEGVDIVNA